MKIAIRADGGSRIGSGHWSRCLYLAGCAGQEITKRIYTLHPGEFQVSFPGHPITVMPIKSESDFFRHISAGDIAIVDGYNFDSEYLKILTKRGGLIVYIDDLLYSNLTADAIVNHCPGIRPDQYQGASLFTSYYLGGTFSLVSGDFTEGVDQDSDKRMTTIVMAMGGADPFNFTNKILQDHTAWFKRFKRVNVIVGSHHKSLAQLQQLAFENQSIVLHYGVSKKEVAVLMNQSGIAILSSSTMALEYAHVGGLLAILQTADNQENLFQGLLQAGVALSVQELIQVKDDLTPLYTNLLNRQKKVFDGLSKERFRKLFDELSMQSMLTLRMASLQDARLTFKWATDCTIRKFSFTQRDITWEEHEQWYNQKINQSDSLYLIAELNSMPVGSIRFDLDKHEAIVSYLVDKSFQGKGLGRILLAQGIKELEKTDLRYHSVVGYVMLANFVSIRIFKRMGFHDEANSKYPDSVKFYKKVT